MRRILLSLLFAVLLACTFVGVKNVVVEQAGNSPVLVGAGSSLPPPFPDSN